MTVHPALIPMAVQWRSEHRYLAKEKQRIEQRMRELEEMLESFFGAMPAGQAARASPEPASSLGHPASVRIAGGGE